MLLAGKETAGERLERVLGKPYSFLHARARRNNEYVIGSLSGREDVVGFLENLDEAREFLKRELEGRGHTYRVSNGDYTEGPEGVEYMSPRQLVRTYIFLGALEKEWFRRHVGRVIEDDLADPYSEHGGLARFSEKGIELVAIESALEKTPENNEAYLLPEEARDTPNIGSFHLHATDRDDSEYAGPSGGAILIGSGDIAAADHEAFFHGESHNLLVTKLAGKQFNTDYYSAESDGNAVVLDLGDYAYA